jgi:hypothetical protein
MMTRRNDLGVRLAIYRFSIHEIVRPSLVIGLMVGVAVLVRACLLQRRPSAALLDAGLAAAVGAVCAGGVFAVASLFFSVEVFERGLVGQTMGGRTVAARWSDISSIERRSALGASYGRLVTGTGADPWIPLWVVNDKMFRELVREHAGADSRVVKSLGDFS